MTRPLSAYFMFFLSFCLMACGSSNEEHKVEEGNEKLVEEREETVVEEREENTNGEPWSHAQLISPEELLAKMEQPADDQPAVLSIGPSGQIKGAKEIGPANEEDNLNQLKQELSTLPKDKTIVVYCGCCPFADCPNIRPAFSLLNEMGFKNPRLLNLPTNLKVDWIDKGYPLEG